VSDNLKNLKIEHSPIALNRTYQESFDYKHNNPYHDRLSQFSDFVLRDKEAEKLKGCWRESAFKNEFSKLVVEVGSGYGQFMIDYSQEHPDVNFIGLDYRFKRSFQLARKLSKLPHQNFKYLRAKGERLSFLFDSNEVDQLFYFFPDPWPKQRHHKKRLFQKPFLQDCKKVLKKNGALFVKTDHDEYFDWMIKMLEKNTDLNFSLIAKTYDLHNDQNEDLEILRTYQTKFEKLFISQGKKIKALLIHAS